MDELEVHSFWDELGTLLLRLLGFQVFQLELPGTVRGPVLPGTAHPTLLGLSIFAEIENDLTDDPEMWFVGREPEHDEIGIHSVETVTRVRIVGRLSSLPADEILTQRGGER